MLIAAGVEIRGEGWNLVYPAIQDIPYWNVDLHLLSRTMIKTILTHFAHFMQVANMHPSWGQKHASWGSYDKCGKCYRGHFSAALPQQDCKI